MAFNDAVRIWAKNGKNGIKNGVKNGVNGVVNGNGNGVKNGVNGIVTPQQAYIKEQAAKRAARQANYVEEKFKPKKPRYLATPVTGKLLAIEGHLKKVPKHRTNPHPKYAKGVIGERTLPITDRIIEAAEVSERVKGPYRQRLREYFFEHDENLLGHMKVVGKLKVAGQEFRGKKTEIQASTGRPDVKLKNRAKDIEEGLRRKRWMDEQTVDPSHVQPFFYSKEYGGGGHHRLELALGGAITDGIDANQVKPFWALVQKAYPNLFPGNNPLNIQRFELGFNQTLHNKVHRRLEAAGLDPKVIKKKLAGKTASQRFAFLQEVSEKLEEIDDFMAREMAKNMRKIARKQLNT